MNRHLFEDRKKRKLFIKSFKNQTLIGTLKGGLDDVYRKSYYDLKERIDKAIKKIDNMFDLGDANTIIDDLLELEKILKGEEDKVEIIEDTPKEDKKIEKLKIYDDMINWCCNGRAINDTEKDIIDKLNKIIDRLNGKDNE